MSNEAFEYKSSAHGSQSVKGPINVDEAEGIVECFVAGIGNKDSVGDVCASGAFTKSLLRRKPRVVWGHNWNDPIGKVLEIYEVGPQDSRLPLKMKIAGIGGLFAKVQFNLNSEKGKEAFANVAFFGEEQEWSIGYKTLRAQFDQKSQANILYEVELYEVSPVLHGANQLTGTISVKTDDSSYGAPVAMMPQRDESNGYEEMEKELSNLFGSKVSVHSIDGDEVVFTRHEMSGAKKYKCGFMRSQGRYMFGTPEVINIPQAPARPSQSAPMPMVSGRPTSQNEPQRVVRPQQMPSIPVAVKPSNDGLVMIPLPSVQYDSNEKPSLDKEEADLRDALLKIVSRHGKFNEDSDGVWAGYTPAAENVIARIGVKCSNCVFYKGGSNCKIIDMPVEPEGKCRFAVIPNGVVLSSGSKELEEHVSEAEDAIIDALELKYPGEFILGIVRNSVGKKRKKRRKYKDLSEYGDDDDMGEKSYLIPVEPNFAYKVKTALDPIFDYHRAETFVDSEGIVITSGVTEDLIDAVDTAIHNLKKKFSEHEIEEKALGYRIGRSLGSRAIDRPTIGGGKRRGRGFGMPEGDLDPRTRVDKNRDGTLFDNIPGWEQPDPTPDGPGSVNNSKLSSRQKRDVSKISGEGDKEKVKPGKTITSREPKYEVDDVSDILDGETKPVKKAAKKAVAKKAPAKKEKVKRGELDFSKKPKIDKDKTPSLSSGEKDKRLTRHSGDPKFESLVSPEELDKRKKFEEVIQDWKDSGYGWMDVPRYKPDVYMSPDYLRGREMGVNQAGVMWLGDNTSQRPKGFNEKQKASLDYQEWYSKMVMRAGTFLKVQRGDDNEFYNGMEDAMHEFMYVNRPETTSYNIDGNRKEPMADWMRQYGFDPGSPVPLRKKKEGKKRSSLSLSSGADDDTKPNFDEENYESDTNVDFYDTLLDMMGPEEERPKVTSRKKPKDMSDEEIYRKRTTTGASLQDVAEELGLTRMEVRKREQRHMRKMRNEKEGVSLSSGASEDWATARGYEPDRFDIRETMNQIGRGNVMAISGGRVERRGNEMILPSTKDQQVVIGYSSVPDLYYVRAEQKINTGKDKGTNRILAQWDEVYADEIGELAYQASLKPANLNSENKEYWKLGKGNQFADRLVDRRSGKLVNRDSRNLPSKPTTEESPSLSSGGRGRDYYNYDIETSDDGNNLLDQIHDSLEENPLIKDDITADMADMLGGDGIVEANGFDTQKAFNLVTGSEDEFQDYLDIVDDAMDALNNGSLAKHKATVRDSNVRLESLKAGSKEAAKLESIRDMSYEWIGDINKYSRVSTIKDKKNIEASDVATRMISKEQDALWNARSSITEKYVEDIASAGKESKRRVPIEKIDSDTNDVPDYNMSLSSGSVMKDGPLSETLASKKDGLALSSGELKATYDEIGKSILEALIEMDKNPNPTYWDVPWRTPSLYARNPTRKNRIYQGTNQILLAHAHRKNNYRGNFWAGESQWAKLGGKPKKGENPVPVLVPIEGTIPRKYKPEYVFNLDQMEGLPEAYVKRLLDVGKERLDPALRVKDAESVIEELKPVVKFGGDRAFFSPTTDHIQMPLYEMFKSPEQYYSTLMHELTHWTGGKSRIGRKQVGQQQDKKAYSFEELIAEMGSSFLLAALDISPEVRTDHVVYIKGWISNLKEDPGAFIRALTQAQAAADYVLDRSPTLRRLSGIPDSERKAKAPKTTIIRPAEKIAKEGVSLSSGGLAEPWQLRDDLRYFGDESQYGSGVISRDSKGRVRDAAGGLSLSSGASRVKNLKTGEEVPALLEDDESYAEKFLGEKDFEPTQQQKAAIDTAMHMVAMTKGSLVIGAGAGSGKTSTMKQIAKVLSKRIPKGKIYYTVFNAGNAKDGNKTMPRNTGVATTNQIAYWSLLLGGDAGIYGQGTTKKLRLSATNKFAKKLKGAQAAKVITATTFDGSEKQFIGKEPGWSDLGYIAPDSIEGIQNILLLLDAETDPQKKLPSTVSIDDENSRQLLRALRHYAITDMDSPTAYHFGPTVSEYAAALLADPNFEFDESAVDKDLVKTLNLIWEKLKDPKSNVLATRDYQIKMWALTRPDLRTDPGLIGHRPKVDKAERVDVGTDLDIVSGKLAIGKTVTGTLDKEQVTGVIMSLQKSSRRSSDGTYKVTAKLSLTNSDNDRPFDIFMFDEAQDMNDVMAKVLTDNALNMPIIMVGDSRQAIYAFRGSIDGLSRQDATYRIPLTQSFRYGSNVQHLANIVLMRENLSDVEWHNLMLAEGVEPGFTPVYHHVKGSAQDVVRETLKITDDNGKRLPKKELNKKLSFIEKTLTLENSAVSFSGLSPTEVDELLDKLRAEHVDSAMGEIVEDMTNPDAIINSTNRGVYEEAMGVIRRGIDDHQMAYLALVVQLDGASKQNLPGIYREISEKYKLNGKSVNLLDENLTDDERNRIIEELIEEHAPGGEEGMVPAIGIPADTHRKMLEFYTQLDWIENNKDTFGKEGRPPVSEKLQGIWDRIGGVEPSPEEIRRRLARNVQNDPETGTLYRLAHPPRVDPAQQIGARGMLSYLKPNGQSYTTASGDVKRYQALKPIREGLSIPAMEVTGDNLTAEKLLAHAKLPPAAVSRGRKSKIGFIIQPQSESVQQGEVFLKLQLDDDDSWTGAVMVGGVGAHGGNYDYRSWMNGRGGGPVGWGDIRSAANSANVQPNYYIDIEKAVKKLKKKYPNAEILFKMEQQQADAKSSQFPLDTDIDAPVSVTGGNIPSLATPRIKFPAWIIKGKDDGETAQIANELGDMVRESAKGGDTDVDVMTTHISKGREYGSVKAGEDFSDPDDMVPVLSDDQRKKILKLPNGLKIIRALEINRRQEENKVYILLTRAMRRLDPGRAISRHYFSDTKENGTPNTRTINSKAAIKNDVVVDGKKIYEDLQIPEGFRPPYEESPEQAEIKERERKAEEKKLDDSMNAFTKKMKERLDAEEAEAKRKAEERKKSGKKDGPIAEDEEDEDDSDEPDFSDTGVDPGISALALDSGGGPILSLSSGAKKKKTNRSNRRLPFSEQERQSLADGDILRSKKVPKKRKPAPSKDEFDDLALASGANTPEGRYARRLRSISLSSGNNELGAGARNQRISGKRFARNISGPKDLASIRVDGDPSKDPNTKRKIEYAMSFWRGVRERGIAFDPQDASQDRKSIEINSAISSVSKSMATRPKTKIGKVSQNQIKDDVNPDEWFVPVSKLRDAIRIPTEFSNSPADPSNPNSRMIARWTQTRPLSNEELGKMLSLNKSDTAKLSDDDAGITHDSVRFLLATMGQQEGFEAWNFFAPTSAAEDGVSAMSSADKFVENLGRANMRDRFIIETFGKDAFPYWIDKDENTVIGQKEYSSLGEVSEMSKFRSSGLFSKNRNESNFSSTAEEMLLEEAVFGGDDTPSDLVKQSVVNAASGPSDKTSREQFDVDQLLKSLGIDKSDKWHEELKSRMIKSFGVSDVGLNTREIARNWEAGGVPTSYINEMIRTGMIPDAKSVWKKDGSGKKLDSELAASKHSVYESLFEFTQSKHAADKAKNTRRNRDYILGSSDFTVSHKGVAARKGATFSKKTGDERRFSQGELQGVVNRFNEIFGTNYKIDDIFSAEQLRSATKRLREEGKTLYGEDASELGKRVILKKDKGKK